MLGKATTNTGAQRVVKINILIECNLRGKTFGLVCFFIHRKISSSGLFVIWDETSVDHPFRRSVNDARAAIIPASAPPRADSRRSGLELGWALDFFRRWLDIFLYCSIYYSGAQHLDWSIPLYLIAIPRGYKVSNMSSHSSSEDRRS